MKPLSIFAKSLVLDILLSSECASAYILLSVEILYKYLKKTGYYNKLHLNKDTRTISRIYSKFFY